MGILSGLFWTILAVGLVALCARHRTTIERWLFPNQRKKSQGARIRKRLFNEYRPDVQRRLPETEQAEPASKTMGSRPLFESRPLASAPERSSENVFQQSQTPFLAPHRESGTRFSNYGQQGYQSSYRGEDYGRGSVQRPALAQPSIVYRDNIPTQAFSPQMSMRDQRLFESKPRYSQSAFVEPRTWSNQENMLPSRGVQERRVVAEEYQELHGDNYEENILDELNEPTLMDYQQLRKQKRAYVSEDYDEEFDANSMETERRYQSELALQNKRRKQTTSPKLERSLSSRPKPSNRQPLVRKRAVPLRQKRRGVFGLDDADTYVEVPASSKRKQSDRDIDEEEDIQYSADMTLEDGWLTPASYQRIKRRKEAGSPRGSALSSQKARTPIKAKDDELEEEEKLEEAVPPPTPIVAPVSNSRGRIKIASGTPVKDKEKFSVGTKVPTPIIRKLSSSAMHDLVDKKIESFNDGLLSAPDSDKKKKVTWGENEVSTFASFSSTSSEEKSVEGSSTGASKELPKVSFSFEVPSFTKPAESKAEEAKITEVTSTPAAEKTPAISFGGITSGFGSAPSPAPAAISFGSLPSSSPSSSTAGTSTSAALAASSLFSGLKSDGKKDTVATPPTGAPFNFGSSTSAIPSEATAPSLSSSGFKPNEQKSVAAGPATLAPPAFGGGFSFSSTPAASAPGTSAPTAPALSASINLATTSSTSSTGPVALPSFGGAASAASSASGGSGGFTVSSQPSSTNFGSLTPAAPAEAPKSSVPASQPASSGLTFNFGGNTSSAPSAAPAPISFGAPATSAAPITFGTPATSAAPISFGAPPAASGSISFSAPTVSNTASSMSTGFGTTQPSGFGQAPAGSSSIPSFGFGQTPAATSAPVATAMASAPSGFSFGQPSGSMASEPPKPSGGSFSFGQTPAPEQPKAAGGFNFGGGASTEAPKPSFGFGQTSASAQPTFNFGQPSSGGSAAAAPPAFGSTGFGSTGASQSTGMGGVTQPASAGGFNFGGPSSTGFGGSTQPGAPAAGGMSFGQSAPSQSMGGFGAPAPSSATGFNFGGTSSGSAPSGFGGPTSGNASSGFNFGQTPAQPSQPAAGPSGGFNFGSSSASGSSATGFAFGGSTPMGGSTSMGGTTPSSGTGFNFGSTSSAQPQQQGTPGGFQFGGASSSNPPAFGASPSQFQFGAGAGGSAGPGAASPGGAPMFNPGTMERKLAQPKTRMQRRSAGPGARR